MLGHAQFWYKLPKTTMDKGLFKIDSDNELMLMCTLMPAERYVDVYVVNSPPLALVPQDSSQPHLDSSHKMSMTLIITSFSSAPNVKKKQRGMLES